MKSFILKMNGIFTFALFLTTVFAGGYKELQERLAHLQKTIEFVEFCSEKFPVSSDDLDAIVDSNKAFPEDDENAKCFLKCLLEKRKYINEKGEVQLLKTGDEDEKPNIIKEALEKCQEIVVATCNEALKLDNCMMDVFKEKFKNKYSRDLDN